MTDEEADALKRAVAGIIDLGQKLKFLEWLENASESRVRVRIPIYRKDWLMSDKPPLPPGQLPGITDTDPPPIHEDTVFGPPVVETVPMVAQEGSTLSCTMGTWTSKPTSYAYQWQIDGNDVGDNAATYETGPSEQGKQATCIVTATNDLGSTIAPPSNAVTVGEARRHPQQEREHHQETRSHERDYRGTGAIRPDRA